MPADLWVVSADATQIHQVLMNLCVNAPDAMARGGELTIRAENVTLDDNYAQHREEVACVLTDMMMPFMDGPATIRALQKMNPQVRIIAASGLGGQDTAAEATAAGVQLFLPKPYTAEKLLKALAQLLRGGAEARA